MADKKRILLVDDEKDFVAMLLIRLEASGYEVLTAYDGEQGLNLAREQKPDLILLDLMLPGMDGYKVCRMLKFDEEYSSIPIIMLTARTQEEDKLKGAQMKADMYMDKPFDDNELLQNIENLLKGK
jgi:two-component system, OmpR family, alkaline phosphatase synthesis response regulator PhoP